MEQRLEPAKLETLNVPDLVDYAMGDRRRYLRELLVERANAQDEMIAHLEAGRDRVRELLAVVTGKPAQAPKPRKKPSRTGRKPTGTSSRGKTRELIMDHLRSAGRNCVSAAEIVKATGISEPTVYAHLKKLIKNDTVVSPGRGQYRIRIGPEPSTPASQEPHHD